jgi:hypothetical protein
MQPAKSHCYMQKRNAPVPIVITIAGIRIYNINTNNMYKNRMKIARENNAYLELIISATAGRFI